MKLVLGDKTYHQPLLNLLKPSIGEARQIQRATQMTIADWRLGVATLNREDANVFAALVYLFRHRAGERVTWDEIDELDPQDVIRGLQFDNTDRELVAKFLPPEVNWMDLVPSDSSEPKSSTAEDGTEQSPVEPESAAEEQPTVTPFNP